MEVTYVGAIIAALAITVLELTEVVALVFALSADHHTIRHGALGAVAGVATVAVLAVLAAAALLALPASYLLWGSAGLLAGFGVVLFRSTVKSYRRAKALAAGSPTPSATRSAVQFAGGFTIGAVETTEAVVVLLALSAAGFGGPAVIGSVGGGVALVVATAAVHDRIRKIKTAWLKLGATSLVFAFAAFWTGEAIGFPWPFGDLALVGLFVLAVLAVRGGVALALRGSARR